jgi:hypothetical protein
LIKMRSAASVGLWASAQFSDSALFSANGKADLSIRS